MFDVGGVIGSNTGSNASSLSSAATDSLDQVGFLNLLVAELQYQDPLDPLDNQDYITQLTQFSSLDELSAIREELEDQAGAAETNLNAQSIGMIGKEVTVVDDTLEHTAGQTTELQFQLPSDTEVTVQIYNSRGVMVREDTVEGETLAGWKNYTFDGKDDNGNYLSDGKYYVQVITPPDDTGSVTSYSVFQTGLVTGIDFTGSEPILELENGQEVPLANVAGVRIADSES